MHIRLQKNIFSQQEMFEYKDRPSHQLAELLADYSNFSAERSRTADWEEGRGGGRQQKQGRGGGG